MRRCTRWKRCCVRRRISRKKYPSPQPLTPTPLPIGARGTIGTLSPLEGGPGEGALSVPSPLWREGQARGLDPFPLPSGERVRVRGKVFPLSSSTPTPLSSARQRQAQTGLRLDCTARSSRCTGKAYIRRSYRLLAVVPRCPLCTRRYCPGR